MTANGGAAVERVVLAAVTVVLLLVMLAPIFMVVVMSFTAGTTLQFPPPGLSLRWYQSAWALLSDPADDSRLRHALLTSFGISLSTMIVVAAVSIPAAYALVRFRFPGRAIIELLLTLPLVFPLIVLGIAFLVIVSVLGIEFGFGRIAIAHVIVTMPFMVRNCAAALVHLPVSHEEAARTLGAGTWRLFSEIVLPAMRSGIVAGMLLAFVISFNEFTVAYFLYTVDAFPLPIWLFSRSNTSLDPTIFAVSSGIIVLDFILISVLDHLVGGGRGVTL